MCEQCPMPLRRSPSELVLGCMVGAFQLCLVLADIGRCAEDAWLDRPVWGHGVSMGSFMNSGPKDLHGLTPGHFPLPHGT